jgi:hypothetical protein
MADGQPRTDYTPRSVFAQRMRHHSNDKYIGDTNVFIVRFDPDFNEFAANVAYALRFLIVYRTDGGKFARGLVRASDDLKHIHLALLDIPVQKATPIRLLARLYRRRDPLAANRWVMSIQFARGAADIVRGDDEPIAASQAVTDRSRCGLMDQIIHGSTILFSEPKNHGPHVERTLKMLAIADRLGCQKAWDLWVYSGPVVFAYVQLFTGDPARKRMTAATAEKFPFNGDSGYDAAHGQWRIYPFQDAANACRGHSAEDCRNIAAFQISGAEKQLALSMDAIFQEKNKLALVSSFNKISSQKFGSSLVADFLDHIQSFIDDPNSLYSVFR